MINLNKLENGNYLGYSYTNSNSIITLKVFEEIKESFIVNSDEISEINIEICNGASIEIAEIYKGEKQEKSIIRNIKNLGHLKHEIIYLSNYETCESTLNSQVSGDGNYEVIVLDFNHGNVNYKHQVNMLEQGNEAHIYCASVVEKQYKKYINNTSINEVGNTIGMMENFGVSFDDGRLEIEGIGDIKKGAAHATNKQKSTMFVMDACSKAISKPLLLIDEDDVIANHASAVGQISEDTIFYLCSRGIEENVARKLIVMGYFKPFIDLIEIEEVHKELESYLNEVINNV